MILRDYQTDLVQNLQYERLKPGRDILMQLSTGGGKTIIIADIVRKEAHPCTIISHRLEILNQISMTFARSGIRHNLILPQPNVKDLVADHCLEFRQSFYAINSRVTIASVDTLIRREAPTSKDSLLIIDEAHHATPDNKWGKICKRYQPGNIIGFSATPMRLDGKSLNKKFGGIFDTLICGIGQRALIAQGFLSDFQIFAPPTADLELANLKISKTTGDYNPKFLSANCAKSTLFGRVAKQYFDFSLGKLGITFATSVENSQGIVNEFKALGVTAAVISAKTPRAERTRLKRDFKEKRLLQLVNVGIFGEGYDLPALEVVSIARPTASFTDHAQNTGRVGRPFPGKEKGIINDHVGNFSRHGLVEDKRDWGFHRPGKTREKGEEDIAIKTCPECFMIYQLPNRICPHCGHTSIPGHREDSLEREPDVDLIQQSVHRGGTRNAWVPEALAYWVGVQRKRGLHKYDISSFFYERFCVPYGDMAYLGGREYNRMGNKVVRDLELYIKRSK